MSYRRLRRALDNECDDLGCRRVTRGGRLRAVLNADDLMTLDARLRDAIGMKTAARELGVKVNRVAELSRSGRLSRTGDSRLSRAAVAGFQEELRLDVPALDPGEAGFISVAEAFKRWVPVKRTCAFFDDILAGVIERRLEPAGVFSLRTLLLSEDGVVAWSRGDLG